MLYGPHLARVTTFLKKVSRRWFAPIVEALELRFLVRSTLVALILDILFNIGLGYYCISLFRVDEAQGSYVLAQLAWLYLPRTVLVFGYRTYLLWPLVRWLKDQDSADDELLEKAGKAAYDFPFLYNGIYSLAFVALYLALTFTLVTSPELEVPSQAMIAGTVLAVAVGLGAFAAGFPLNLVMNGPMGGQISLLARERQVEIPALAIPFRLKILVLAFCLSLTPCFVMLSSQVMVVADGDLEQVSWQARLALTVLVQGGDTKPGQHFYTDEQKLIPESSRLSAALKKRLDEGFKEGLLREAKENRALAFQVADDGRVAVAVASDRVAPLQTLDSFKLVCALLAAWTVLSAFMVNLTISRPVEKIKRVVDQIFEGTEPAEIARTPVYYRDELGVLASGTNRMVDQLEASGSQIASQLAELASKNEELQEATRVKGEFLATMSHDLRTPLNAIIGFSKILLRKTKDSLPERQFKNVHLINQSGHQLLSLVNDILDFEKIEAGRLTINPTEVDCEDLARNLAYALGPAAQDAGLELKVEVVEAPLAIWTDPDRLHQIMTNFINNAIKYAGSGEITVKFERVEDQLSCSVSDQGPGIDAEQQKKVFSPFHQLSDGKKGVGLGLAIVQKLAGLLGGRVELESTLGEGSTFSFLLPSSHELGEQGLGRFKPLGDGPDLLVVDDQPQFLEIMHGELSEAGYRVHLARSGEQALSMLDELLPAAILLDIVMPGLSGWDTIKRLRSNPQTAHVPVIVASILDDTPVGYELGISAWLTKPVSADEFKQVMVRVDPAGRVLIVDDDEATRSMLGQMLAELEVSFVAAANGKDALETLQATPDISAMILDLGLPDIDGFEVVQHARALPGGEAISVVAYTGRELSDPEREELKKSLVRVVEKQGSNSVAKVVKAVTKGQADA